jgi:TonB family protein
VQRYFVKFLFFSLVILTSTMTSYSQVLDTLYYNQYWQLVTRDSAKQFRVAEIDTVNLWFTGKFRDYYADSSLLMEGQYSKSGLKNGPFKILYPDGQVYCKGFFDNDMLSGRWEYFNRDGKLMERVQFEGADFIVLDSYDAEGKRQLRNGNGKWVKVFVDGKGFGLEASGRYYNGKREGNWRLKNMGGETVLLERYTNDYFIDGVIYLPRMEYYNETRFTSNLFYPGSLRTIESFLVWQAYKSDYPYLTWLPFENDSTNIDGENIEQPDKAAHYPLGMEAFYKRVAQVLIYPGPAQTKRIEGKVYIEFIVGTDGYLYDARVVRGIGGGCDQQALIAVLAAGRWFPAQKNGRPVEQKMLIPVTFRLEP